MPKTAIGCKAHCLCSAELLGVEKVQAFMTAELAKRCGRIGSDTDVENLQIKRGNRY